MWSITGQYICTSSFSLICSCFSTIYLVGVVRAVRILAIHIKSRFNYNSLKVHMHGSKSLTIVRNYMYIP